MAKGYKKMNVTEELFNKARVLFNAGLNEKQVVSVLGVSSATANRFHNCHTWADYMEIKARHAQQKQIKNVVVNIPVVGSDIEQSVEDAKKPTDPVLGLLRTMREEIQELRASVQWIADNAVVKVVEVNPTKRKRFF